MITRICTWAGVTATIYWLDKGEKVTRHKHPVEHTTMVIAGKTAVDVNGDYIDEMTVVTPVKTLPANIDHEITALEDGTIVLNMIQGSFAAGVYGDYGTGVHGGVLLDDGTVVPHGS